MLVFQQLPAQPGLVMAAHQLNGAKQMSSITFAGHLKNLEPARVWEIFEEITKIYRESGPNEHSRENNKEISNYLVNKLKPLGFDIQQAQEGAGKYNIIATRNVDKNKRNAIILQAHMDMVCISDDKNPKKPIKLKIDGDYLRANNRTLGADNGIGIAMAIAVAEDPKFSKLPLEIIFTVDEETGMYGAAAMNAGDLYGNKLINIDSEKYGEITIGCAGMDIFKEIRKVPVEPINSTDYKKITLSIKDAQGGHSGEDINKDRLNPIKAALAELNNYKDIRISSITGGEKPNSIPREVTIELLAPQKTANIIADNLINSLNSLKDNYKKTETNLKVNVQTESKNTPAETVVLKEDFQNKLLNILGKQLHSGMKSVYENGDTKTSQNLGILNLKGKDIELAVSMRSSEEDEKKELFNQTTAQLSELFDEPIKPFNSSPIWQPKHDSALTKLAAEAYKEIGIEKPRVYTCHGGLENAQFAAKKPELDHISVGPTIHDPHTVNERINIPSVENFYKFLQLLLQKMSK
jgi:dipeptidase D